MEALQSYQFLYSSPQLTFMLSLSLVLYSYTLKIPPYSVITSAYYSHMCFKELGGNMVSYIYPDIYHLCFVPFIPQDQIFFCYHFSAT